MTWTLCAEARPFAAHRMICFPHAGGSAYAFREWTKGLPGLEVHTVCYPGRADRLAEPPATDLVELARLTTGALLPMADRPLVLFGHSMGAAVAYETARALEAEGVQISHLFVSGARAPHRLREHPAPADREWDDDAVIATLAELGGTDAELLDNEMFRELILPYVKADFRMLASYTHRPEPPLACPVTAVIGDSDQRATAEQAAAWGQLTKGAFSHRTRPGGHFYLSSDPPFDLIDETLGDDRGRS